MSAEGAGARSARRERRGVVATLLGGTCWGVSGTMASLLFDSYGVGTMWLVAVRQLGAGVLFLVFDLLFERGRLVKLWTTPRHLAILFAFTFLGLLPNHYLYLLAVRLTNAGTATVLECLQLLVILAFTCARARSAPRGREVAGVVLALAGTWLIATGGSLTSLRISAAGLFAGLLCAASAACISLIPAKILPEYGSPAVTGSGMLLAGLVSGAFVRPWEDVPELDATGAAALLVFVAVGSFLAFLLYLQGVKDVGGMRASLLGTVEPVVATVTSALMLGTVFLATDIAGFVLVIAMVFLTARREGGAGEGGSPAAGLKDGEE